MKNLSEIKIDIENGSKPYYVYLLFKPDDTPFYVGKGKSNRISAHEAETRYFLNGRTWKGLNAFKVNTIAKIWSNNETVRYEIDSWHDESSIAGDREIELVERFGRRILDTGPLTNIRDGGDLMTEEDRRIFGEKIRQYYIDHPEAREAVSERMIQYRIDNPYTEEQKEHLSDVLKNYCIENPDFIVNLQIGKNKWIFENPEEYAATELKRKAICSSDVHREKISDIMRNYFQSNPDELERIKKQGSEYWIDNPEARERARQISIDNNSGQHLKDFYASDDPEVLLKRKIKAEAHSEFYLEWHKTEEGKEKTKQAAIKRNEKVRTDDHRSHMSVKTKEFMLNNPEADAARRAKVAETRRKVEEVKQKCLFLLSDILFKSGKIARPASKVDYSLIYKWRKAKLVPEFFPKHGGLLEWEKCFEDLSKL